MLTNGRHIDWEHPVLPGARVIDFNLFHFGGTLRANIPTWLCEAGFTLGATSVASLCNATSFLRHHHSNPAPI